jgi:hypothetical protein
MTAVREQCLSAVRTRLATIPGATVYRNRLDPIAPGAMPAVNLFDGGHNLKATLSGHDEYELRCDVEMYVTAANDAALGAAFSALYSQVVAAVMEDVALGGVAQQILEGDMTDPEFSLDDPSPPLMAASLRFEIEYWTEEGDPETLAP